jgi:hypothetical protein
VNAPFSPTLGDRAVNAPFPPTLWVVAALLLLALWL